MSTASFDTPANGDPLVTPRRAERHTTHAAVAGVIGRTATRGPRLVVRLPELGAPALSTAHAARAKTTVAETVAASTSAAEAGERVGLSQRLRRIVALLQVREHLVTAIRVVLFRNLMLLMQPQMWLQPKLLLTGVGAIVMTMAGLIISGGRTTPHTDQLGAAPAWEPPSIAAPNWNTVAQPTATEASAASSTTAESEAPPFCPPPTANATSVATGAPFHVTTPAPALPAPALGPNQPMTAAAPPAIDQRYPSYPTSGQATANGPAAVERYPQTIARRPESPSAYPPTAPRETPPQARITGRINVLPGEPTP